MPPGGAGAEDGPGGAGAPPDDVGTVRSLSCARRAASSMSGDSAPSD